MARGPVATIVEKIIMCASLYPKSMESRSILDTVEHTSTTVQAGTMPQGCGHGCGCKNFETKSWYFGVLRASPRALVLC